MQYDLGSTDSTRAFTAFWRVHMSIHSLFSDELTFDPEDIAVLSIAFEDTLRSLRLVKRSDPAVSIVAKHIIEIAKSGERDPMNLRERTLRALAT
jgi:hypothetical protein